MPYDSISDLPDRIKERFKSTEERRAFKEAYNAAYEGTCKDGGRQGDREGCSMAVATEAAKGVKKGIAKNTITKQDGDAGDESARSLVARLASALQALITGAGTEHGYAEATVHHFDEEEDMSFRFRVSIAKADDEKQIVYGIVLEPEVEDAQEDVVSADEIEKAAHRFLAEYTLGQAELGLEHVLKMRRGAARIVETFLAPVDFEMRLGEKVTKVKKGSWVMGVHIPEKRLWKAVKDEELTGFSIGGKGERIAA